MAIEPISQHGMSLLRESELFKGLSEDVLKAVLLQSSTQNCPDGDVLFEQGTPGDSLFVVKSGVVEISARTGEEITVLAYLGRGECIGEVALLTGSARTATARVPERAELLVISGEVFEDLIANVPAFLKQLCVILARRLERTIGKVPGATQAKQLEGHLRYFDLGLVLQTLADSKQTGWMHVGVPSIAGHQRAELYFEDGAIVWARMGQKGGEEVVYQLFQTDLGAGVFHFAGANVEGPPQPNIACTPMSLLLESARLQDELAQARKRLPNQSRSFRRKAAVLSWAEAETEPLASELWAALDSGATLGQLLQSMPVCDAKVYQMVWELLCSGQIT